MNKMKKALPYAILLIVLVASFRLMPHHIYNFTPVGAIALFSGAYLGRNLIGWLIPISIMLISDTVLELTGAVGFHKEMPFVYGAFLIAVLIGRYGLKQKKSFGRVLGATISSSMLFFIITNFGSWILSPAYTKDFSGLVTCYVAAIPFYTPGDYLSSFALNGLLGDLFFTGLLFGAYELITRRMPSVQSIKA